MEPTHINDRALEQQSNCGVQLGLFGSIVLCLCEKREEDHTWKWVNKTEGALTLALWEDTVTICRCCIAADGLGPVHRVGITPHTPLYNPGESPLCESRRSPRRIPLSAVELCLAVGLGSLLSLSLDGI